MRNPYAYCGALSAFLTVLVVPASHAEIFKWTDSAGRTHYSERKPAAAASAVDLKAGAEAKGKPPVDSGAYWSDQERQFRQRQAERSAEKPPQLAPLKSLSGGRAGDSDASRCNLARDILSGAVRHASGAPIDQYDRDVAEKDVARYCR